MSDAFADLRPRFEANGQGHVFQWYDKGLLTDEQVASLRAQLEPMNLERINHLFKETMAARVAGISEDGIAPCRKVENVGKIGKETIQGWHDKGLRAIAAGEVRCDRQFRWRRKFDAVFCRSTQVFIPFAASF
jgi:hypothetical protein